MTVFEKFNINTNHKSLYNEAFTHTSYANEQKTVSYERLEYLGDAVLELIMSEYLYKNTEYPIIFPGNTLANMVRNATSFAPTFPGVGIGETDMYKNT